MSHQRCFKCYVITLNFRKYVDISQLASVKRVKKYLRHHCKKNRTVFSDMLKLVIGFVCFDGQIMCKIFLCWGFLYVLKCIEYLNLSVLCPGLFYRDERFVEGV